MKSINSNLRIFAGVCLIALISYLVGFFLGGLSVQFANDFSAGNNFASQRVVPLESGKYSASAYIAAVDSRGNGVLSKADVEIIDGKGRVLFNTNPFVEPDTQYSLETAAKIAFSYTEKNMGDKDVIFSVTDTPAELIGGPSAGGAFTVATIAAIEGKDVNTDVAMTGTIESDGSIGPVGGVIEKATAASQSGVKLFLVPKGQSTVTVYKEVIEEQQRGFLRIRRVRLVPQQIDLVEYAKDNLEIEIMEVENIDDAVKQMVV